MKKLLLSLLLTTGLWAQLPTDLAVTKTNGTTLAVAAGLYHFGNSASYNLSAGTVSLFQAAITSITQESQVIVTLGSAWPTAGLHNNDQVYITGASGCSALNGLKTVVGVTSATTVRLNVDTSSGCGSYSGSSATFGANPSATGTVYISGKSDGTILIQSPSAAGLVLDCATIACVINQVTTPDFAPGCPGIPIATVSLTSTGNGNFGTVTEARSVLAGCEFVAGAGISISPSGGTIIISIDTSLVPQLGSDNVFTASNDFTAGTVTRPVKSGASDPATCTVDKDLFINSTTHKLKLCTATNTWTIIGPP